MTDHARISTASKNEAKASLIHYFQQLHSHPLPAEAIRELEQVIDDTVNAAIHATLEAMPQPQSIQPRKAKEGKCSK